MRPITLTENIVEEVLASVKSQLLSANFAGASFTYTVPSTSVALKDDEKVQIHFTERAYYKMKELVSQSYNEIAWDGSVERDPDNPRIFTVTDIFVYPQIVSSATVDTDDEKYAAWLMSLDDDVYNKRRFNGHSHVNMGCTPSSTDHQYREQSMRNVKDFFIYGIFNKRNEHTLAVYDIENNVMYDDKDIDMYIPIPDYSGWAKEIIKANISNKTYNYAGRNTTYNPPGAPKTAAASTGTAKPPVGGASNVTNFQPPQTQQSGNAITAPNSSAAPASTTSGAKNTESKNAASTSGKSEPYYHEPDNYYDDEDDWWNSYYKDRYGMGAGY